MKRNGIEWDARGGDGDAAGEILLGLHESTAVYRIETTRKRRWDIEKWLLQ